ncbi:MAG: hypothetical protein AAGJ32_11225 [Pseudomonadota bacterium]
MPNRSRRKVVLVTGCPRSGTTAIGEVLSRAPGCQYLYEPMNFASGDAIIGRYFEVPGSASFPHDVFDSLVDRIGSLKLDLKPGHFQSDTRLYKIAKTFVGGRSRQSLWRCRLHPGLETIIWKDPIAASAAIAAAERHDIPVLVTVRPVHAIAASFKRMGWGFDVKPIHDDLVALGLIEPLDLPFACENLSAINGAMLSVVLYTALLNATKRLPQIRFVAVDDIINAPHASYRAIFDWLGLGFSKTVTGAIDEMYKDRPTRQAVPTGGRAHSRTHNVGGVNQYWRRVLTGDEIQQVDQIANRLDHALLTPFSLAPAPMEDVAAGG